jgi:Terminase large subunit, T4likevirus-type, N-terminal
VSTAQLRREISYLRERRPSRRRLVTEDRVEFAHSLGIVPDSWQERLLRSDAPRVLLNCARQSGKSTMAGIIALHQALLRRSSLVLILAPAERQAKELFSKVAEAYRALGHIIPADSYRKMGMELANGSRIEALPGTEKTIRGFSGVDLLLVDEASRVADELYYAVRPMLAVSGGRLMMLSTPYGRRGVFFEEWTDGQGWERYEVPASQCPRISEEFLEEELRALPRRVFRQEYECSFEETDDQVFSHADVQAAISEEVTPLFGVASG